MRLPGRDTGRASAQRRPLARALFRRGHQPDMLLRNRGGLFELYKVNQRRHQCDHGEGPADGDIGARATGVSLLHQSERQAELFSKSNTTQAICL